MKRPLIYTDRVTLRFTAEEMEELKRITGDVPLARALRKVVQANMHSYKATGQKLIT